MIVKNIHEQCEYYCIEFHLVIKSLKSLTTTAFLWLNLYEKVRVVAQ